MKTNNITKMFFNCALLLVLTLSISGKVQGLKFSEIMYNPDGADTGREWMEIEINESDGCLNLTQYKLFEEGTNHNIYKFDSDIACKYAIIVSDTNKFLLDYTYLNKSNPTIHNLSLKEDLSDIIIYKSSFSLNNAGEYLALKKDSNKMDDINYTSLLEYITVAEGYSLEYYQELIGYWRSSDLLKGNPGDAIIEQTQANDTTVNDTINDTGNNNINQTINDTVINETINISINNTENITINNTINDTINETINATINDSNIINTIINISDNTTGNNQTEVNFTNETNTQDVTNNTNIANTSLTNSTLDNITVSIVSCNATLSIIIKNVSMIYENDVPIKFQNKLDNLTSKDKGYLIEYWIEDLFGNIVKSKINSTNQEDKSFTPKIDEAYQVFIIKSILRNLSCNLNLSEKMFVVKNSHYISPLPKLSSTCTPCTKASACTPSTCKVYQCPTLDLNCSQPPIKIVNVCNASKETSKNNTKTIEKNMTSLGLQLNVQNNTNNLNRTQNAGQTTGMITYESPNLKNRLFALIGLILVGLTCIGFVIYKIYDGIMIKTQSTATESKR